MTRIVIMETSTEFIASRLAHCFAEGQVDDSSISLDGTLDKLDKLSDDTRDYLAGILRDESFQEASDYALDRLLIFMMNRGASTQDIEDVACVLSSDELILEQSSDYFDWEEEDPLPSYSLKELLSGLRSYTDIDVFPYDKTQPIRRQGQRIIDQSMALLSMAQLLEMVNEYQFVDGMTVIPDYDVVDLTAEFPERFAEVADLLADREYEHVHGIREVLTGEVHKSLADGVI